METRNRSRGAKAGAVLASVAVYLLCGWIHGLLAPGLQYDEAIFAHGSVHMLHGQGAPPFANHAGSWMSVAGQPVQLMVMPYAGSAKSYILMPLFAAAGPSIGAIRTVSLLLGATGIACIVLFVSGIWGNYAGLAAGLVLAVHPGYVAWTAFDNTGFALWAASLGAVLLAVRRFVHVPTAGTAIVLGVALGFAVWSRANFVWPIAGAGIAAVVVGRRETLRRWRYAPFILAGGIAGGLPLLLYLIRSRFGTLQMIADHSTDQSLWSLVPIRLQMAWQSLFYDPHRRTIWGGESSVPVWETNFVLAIIAASLVLAIHGGRLEGMRARWARAAGITLIATIPLTLTARLWLAPYHFITYLPIAVIVGVAASCSLSSRVARAVAALCFAVLIVSSARWNFLAGEGMRATGGKAFWSNSIVELNRYLLSNHPHQVLNALDWGFGNGLYVLSNGRLTVRELFWGFSETTATDGSPWKDWVRPGEMYVHFTAPFPHSEAAEKGFFNALKESGIPATQKEFRQADGEPFATITYLPQPEEADARLLAPEVDKSDAPHP
jgi:hypothetical protein